MTVPTRLFFTRILYNQLSIQGISPKIYVDIDYNGVWWNARRAWSNSEGDYHIVLQDDVEISPTFVENIYNLISFIPDLSVISFCHDQVDNHLIQKKIAKGLRWHIINSCRTAQALMMNSENVYQWLKWDYENIPFHPKAYDDARLAEWQIKHSIPLYLTIPELCHHIGLPSTADPQKKRYAYTSSLVSTVITDWSAGLNQAPRKLPHHSLEHIRGTR